MIEDKLIRLTADQRREVEDFIDFLLERDGHQGQACSSDLKSGFTEIQDLPRIHTDDLFSRDHDSSRTADQDILPGYPDYGDIASPMEKDDDNPGKSKSTAGRPVAKKVNSKKPSQLLDWME